MKVIAYVFILLFVATSCGEERVPLYEASMEAGLTIPSGLNTIETHYFTIRNVPTNFAITAKTHNIDTTSIQNIVSSRGLIRSRFSDIDLDFIGRISIYAVSQKDPNIKREMYYLDQIPFTIDEEIRMLSSSTELKEILKEELIDLEVRLNFRDFTPPNCETRINFGYAVF